MPERANTWLQNERQYDASVQRAQQAPTPKRTLLLSPLEARGKEGSQSEESTKRRKIKDKAYRQTMWNSKCVTI
jgi:hypothetical protein